MLAPAKINLSLNITGRRDDGYHLLHSYVVFADYGDEIVLEPSGIGYFLSIEGPFADQINIDDNIINQAVELFQQHLGHPLKHRAKLTKNIPVGAGLGGGSSDAAATIKLLMETYNVEIEPSVLKEMLLSLGADVPVCYKTAPCLMEGIGDVISPIKQADKVLPALLVYPDAFVSTPDVFKNYLSEFSQPQVLDNWFDSIDGMKNDLTVAAMQIEPKIQTALDLLKEQNGCIASRMSGSGSTCFALFENVEVRDKVHNAIQQAHSEWWVQPVSIEI